MAYYHCDESSDDCLSDDGAYYEYKEKMKRNRIPRILTDAEKLENEKKLFYSALCNKNKELALEFINKGFEVNMDLGDSWTPLLVCASSGNAELTEELIKRGADISCRRDGMTALMMACNCPKDTAPFSESLKIIKNLIQYGADPKFINRRRITALMFAANAGNLSAVEFLLPLSDKDAEDNQRWTALFWAINGNEVKVVEYLLQEGLKYNIKDVRNNTPLDIAKNNGFTKIVNLFPSEEPEILSSIIDSSYHSFEDIFNQTKSGEKPQFFLDICNFLFGVKAESTIPFFADNNISLSTFLSLSDDDLKSLGVNMPYQRYRILAGIHKFHKKPFHPKSFHVIKSDQVYSTIDVAAQLLTIIKQLIIIEAGLSYMTKNHVTEELSEEEMMAMIGILQLIRRRTDLCKQVTNTLVSKISQWDRVLKPADLITSSSRNSNFPWRKVVISMSLLSVVFICKLRC